MVVATKETNEDVMEAYFNATSAEEKSNIENYLVEKNFPLIIHTAFRFKNKVVEYDDRLSVCMAGFLHAIRRYEKSAGVKLTTFAVKVMTNELLNIVVKTKRPTRYNGDKNFSIDVKMNSHNGEEKTFHEYHRDVGVDVEKQAVNRALIHQLAEIAPKILATKQRQLFFDYLLADRDMTNKEIAKEIGGTPQSVDKLKQQIRLRFKKHFDSGDIF